MTFAFWLMDVDCRGTSIIINDLVHPLHQPFFVENILHHTVYSSQKYDVV